MKKASLDRMWTIFPLNDGKPNSGNYGFAWAIDQMNGHWLMEHSGAWQGFTTYIGRYVDDGLTVTVLANLDSGHARPGKIGQAVAGLLNPALAPPKLKALPDTEPKVTAFLRATLNGIAAGAPDPQAFTPEARAAFFPERIKETGMLLKEQGPPQTFELVVRNDQGDEPIRRYRLRGQDGGNLLFTFRLSKDGKIAGMRFAPE